MSDILDYMYNLHRFGIRMGLETVERLVAAIGDPQQSFQSVHVTGTNGKGSTASFVATILQEAGHTVGLYTSPHLVRFNERIRVNGEDISDDELERLALHVKEVADKNDIHPTFFEFTTVVAFLHFRQRRVNIAVIEVGMGGRLDATNIIKPLVSVITNIGWDHMQVLGDTLPAIAAEKAGIIKPGCTLVTAEKDSELRAYFKQVCAERQATYVHVDEVVAAIPFASDFSGQRFAVTGIMADELRISLLGVHQIRNALTALVVAKELQKKGVALDDDSIKTGLAKTVWAGRIDIISKKPLVILDGAHNLPGMETLAAFAANLPRRKVLMLAMKFDKDVDGMMELIVPLFEKIIITEGNYKPTPASELAEHAKKYNRPVYVEPDVEKALDLAFSWLGDDTFVITGSLYMVGDALKALRAKKLLAPTQLIR